MDIDPSFEISVRDPLSEITRKERRSLLALSTLGIIMVKTGLIPERISAFGVEFSKTDQKSLLFVVAFIIVYFLVSFVIYAWSDFASWRIAVNSARQRWLSATADSEETKKVRQFHELSDKIFNWGKHSIGVSWVRAFWEFLFPLFLGLYSTYFLVTTNPVGTKLLSN